MNALGLTGIIALFIAIAVITAGILIPPKLASLPKRVSFAPTLADGGDSLFGSSFRPAFSALNSRSLAPAALATKRFAFFEMANPIGRVSLLEHMDALDGLMPDFLVLGRSGELRQKSKDVEQRLRKKMQGAPNLQIYPRLSNAGVIGSDNLLASHLSEEAVSQKLTLEILDYLDRNSDAGITLDFSEIEGASHPQLFRFLRDLRSALHSSNKVLILILNAPSNRRWMQEFAQAVDFVVITLFRQKDNGPSGPLASQGWFETQLAALSETVDPSKVIVAIGSFGRDFGRPPGSQAISVPHAWQLLREGGIKLKFDEKSLNPWFRYTDASGLPHDVWLLDAATVFNQAKAALTYRPAGLALSTLGTEDPGIWACFGKGALPGPEAIARMEHPPAAFYVDPFASKPEIVSATFSATKTVRRASFDESLGLIVKEAFETPSPGRELVAWHPVSKKLLALTFDDGPDKKVTGQILDVLAAKSVKATFFLIGKSALDNRDVLRRAYREGHDIGNHTFTHPRVSELSAKELELQLTSTQRALEAILGIHTRLFRPTYAGGIEDLENLPIVEETSKLGYLTVLSAIDSYDWILPQPPARKMLGAVLNQVASGNGQIILFHDQGKKQATLEVLPQIIDSLRAEGFRFVPIHELIGRSRDDVMPKAVAAGPTSEAAAAIRQSGLLAVSAVPKALTALSVMLAIITITRYAFVVIAASKHWRRERRRESVAHWPPVAVIVPAYNEEKVICKTVASVLAAPQKDFEVIVVDDGSSDGTAQAVRQAYAHDPRVKVFVKANGGKAAAANFALSQTQAEAVICIDADTILAENAIPLLVRHFSDSSVGAVAGTAVVGNQINLLTRFQAMEYALGQYLDRRAFALCNATGVVPGAIGAWRREALLSVGGYSSDTLAEDADATYAIATAGWKVIYEPAAEARTEAPETLRAFLRQRYRWMFGTLQVAFKHIPAVYRKTCGLGFLTIPNVFLSLIGFACLLPIIDLASIVVLGLNLKNYLAATEPALAAAHFDTIAYWMVFQAVYIMALAVALTIVNTRRKLNLVFMLLLQRFLYSPLLYWVAAVILVGALKGRSFGWRKLTRTGSVNLHPGLPDAVRAQQSCGGIS